MLIDVPHLIVRHLGKKLKTSLTAMMTMILVTKMVSWLECGLVPKNKRTRRQKKRFVRPISVAG